MTISSNRTANVRSLQMSDSEQKRIASVLFKISGIEIPQNKRALVQARLAKRVAELGKRDFSDYCDYLEDKRNSDEHSRLISAMTTNVTKFFREDHHFKYLSRELLTQLVERSRRGNPLRIWSAGCSSGEEPYSLAMTILEECPNASDYSIKIVATDIDRSVLETARQGVFSKVDSSIPRNLAAKYFTSGQSTDSIQASKKLRDIISFSELNLNAAWPSMPKFDVIMCRNVVIYFAPQQQHQLWQKFASNLAQDGHLMIGHSERIPTELQVPLKLVAPSTYQKLS